MCAIPHSDVDLSLSRVHKEYNSIPRNYKVVQSPLPRYVITQSALCLRSRNYRQLLVQVHPASCHQTLRVANGHRYGSRQQGRTGPSRGFESHETHPREIQIASEPIFSRLRPTKAPLIRIPRSVRSESSVIATSRS